MGERCNVVGRKYSKSKNERTRRKSGGPNKLGQVTPVVYLLPKDVMMSEFFWWVKDVTSSGENILSPKTKERGGNLAAEFGWVKDVTKFF